MADLDAEKRAAGAAAAALAEPGQRIGLGTGSTVAPMLEALAARRLEGLRCVATSVATERRAAELGLAVEPFDTLDLLDLAIDGADQIAPDGWIVKGGGGAHTREKVVALAAERFVVIAASDKAVSRLHPPIPLELLQFGLPATLRELGEHGRVAPRPGAPLSPDGHLIADLHAPVPDPAELAAELDAIPGVVSHGLFAPELTTDVVIARGGGVEHRTLHHD